MIRKRHYILSILMLFCCTIIDAQQKLQFSIFSFQADKFDTTANIGNHVEVDGSGNKYAIIKVSSNNPEDNITEYNFNFGNMASHVKEHDGELWVYVQRNAKNVTISRSGYTTIGKYNLGMTIEAGQVYKMVLTSDRIQQQIVYDVRMQMVMFQITPAVAGLTVMIKDQNTDGQTEIFGMTDKNGAVAKSINYGKYTYSVLSPDKMYHVSEGLLTISNSDETFVEKVSLRPNYADMTLVAEDDVEIFVNNESKGKGRWTGRMVSGDYIITCKQPNYRDSQQRLTVKEGKPETVDLLRPTPITGSLTVNTSPLGATIKIDGKDYGQSPRIIKDVLIGTHNVELSLADHKTESKNVIIKENDMASMEVTLEELSTVAPVVETSESRPADVPQQVMQSNTMYNIPEGAVEMNLSDMLSYPLGDSKLPHITTYKYSSILDYFRKSFDGFSRSSGSVKGCGVSDQFILSKNFYYKGKAVCLFNIQEWKSKQYAKISMSYGFLIPASSTYKGAKEYAQTILLDIQNLGYTKGWTTGDEDKENYGIHLEKNNDSSFCDLSVYRSQEGWTVHLHVLYK